MEHSSSLLSDYRQESIRPLVSLVFVAPMLLVYEGGVVLLGPDAMRNGAEAWLRQLLVMVGFGQYLLLPLLTCALLLAWHHTTHQQWRISWKVLNGMALESACLGFLLLIVAGSFFHSLTANVSCAAAARAEVDHLASRIIGYVGAGLYEELLFRLMLLPAVAGLVRLAGGSRRTSLIAAITITSLVFSAAHYRVFTGYGLELQWSTFAFRALAGAFFSLLFVYRGFGITAGAHALYDIFAELL